MSLTLSRTETPADDRAAAAERIVACERELAMSGRSVLDCLAPRFEPGADYPAEGFADAERHSYYFYHVHSAAMGSCTNVVHFHAFLGKPGMPAGARPAIFPELALAPLSGIPDSRQAGPRFPGVFSHLVALGIDAAGVPDRLFTTNRWVTGETWYAAEDVTAMLPRFGFAADPADPAARVGAWLADVLCLLRPMARQLLVERDRKIAGWRRRRTRQIHVWEDRRLEVVSECRIDFAAELAGAIAGK